ncbi:hypothetical protein ACS2TZ_41840, partial [Bacillus cereus group sp. Bce025]
SAPATGKGEKKEKCNHTFISPHLCLSPCLVESRVFNMSGRVFRYGQGNRNKALANSLNGGDIGAK